MLFFAECSQSTTNFVTIYIIYIFFIYIYINFSTYNYKKKIYLSRMNLAKVCSAGQIKVGKSGIEQFGAMLREFVLRRFGVSATRQQMLEWCNNMDATCESAYGEAASSI